MQSTHTPDNSSDVPYLGEVVNARWERTLGAELGGLRMDCEVATEALRVIEAADALLAACPDLGLTQVAQIKAIAHFQCTVLLRG